MRENQNKRPIPGCKVMSKDGFWNLIAEVRAACGQDQDKYMDMLKTRLKEQGAEYAQDFHNIVHAYKDLAYKYGLWSACGLMGPPRTMALSTSGRGLFLREKMCTSLC